MPIVTCPECRARQFVPAGRAADCDACGKIFSATATGRRWVALVALAVFGCVVVGVVAVVVAAGKRKDPEPPSVAKAELPAPKGQPPAPGAGPNPAPGKKVEPDPPGDGVTGKESGAVKPKGLPPATWETGGKATIAGRLSGVGYGLEDTLEDVARIGVVPHIDPARPREPLLSIESPRF